MLNKREYPTDFFALQSKFSLILTPSPAKATLRIVVPPMTQLAIAFLLLCIKI